MKPALQLRLAESFEAGCLLRKLSIEGIAVPGDLSIIGFDDSPTATHIWPALSTVRWPIREMGARAARTLVPDFLDGAARTAAADESPVLASTFVERQSVAPPTTA